MGTPEGLCTACSATQMCPEHEPVKQSNEQRYFDALKRITKYMSPERLRARSEREYGLSFEEALEMAYDNIQGEAEIVVRGKRRPKS